MINYLKNEETLYQGLRENLGRKAEDLFLLGEKWKSSKSQKDSHGELSLLDG